jgi:cytochrome c556
MEIHSMTRKWIVFASSAAILVALGGGVALSSASDEETPLGKIMEKVQKHNLSITKGVRNKVAFKKSQKDVENSAKELAKLAKEAKPLNDAVKKAKDIAEPQKKWDAYFDEFVKTSTVLGDVAGSAKAKFEDTKKAFNALKKVCSDCHHDFRIEENF